MKSIILGTATGYPSTVLERFAGSAREAGIGGRIVLCVDPDSVAHYQPIAKRYDVELIAIANLPYHIQTARYLVYQELLERRLQETEYALLCDVRDLLFVRDLFSHPELERHQLHLFLEDQEIGRCRYNAAWIEYAFGQEFLQRVASLPVSCSGTTIGSRAALLHYLTRLNTLAQKLHTIGREIVCGLDQGLHNGLLYGENILNDSRRVWRNTDGFIFTMGYAQHTLSERGIPQPQQAEGSTGEPFVLHQFDRMKVEAVQALGVACSCPMDDIIESGRP
jgi:hypothetical protein